jgi:uncharacterized protein (DUF1697 family)
VMTSKRYIALLRAVNVGRAKRIAMADLRTLVAGLGYTDVRSVSSSGNVVFSAAPLDTAAAAIAIEEVLVLKLGVAAPVIVLASDELATIINENPLLPLATDHARLLTFILADPAMRSVVEHLCDHDWGREALALGQRAAYVWCPTGVLDSAAAAALGKHLGDSTTSRNWSTLEKLHGLCTGDGQPG